VIKDNFGVDVESDKGSTVNLEIISEASQFEESHHSVDFDVVKEYNTHIKDRDSNKLLFLMKPIKDQFEDADKISALKNNP